MLKLNNISLIILLLASPVFLYAGSAQQELIARGDSAYDSKNYLDAAALYQQVLDQGYESAALYYNLGNAFFNLNRLPEAILFYERARILSPRDPDIIFNLNIANSMIPDKIEAVPEIFYVGWWKSLRDGFNLHTWALICLIVFTMVMACAAFFILSQSLLLRKLAFWFGIALIMAGIAVFSIAYSKHEIQSKHLEAIVFDPTITVKSSPNKLGKDLFVIHEGTKVFILEEINDWANIRIASGSTGWMPLSSIKRI